MARRMLLACGILSSLVYVAADVVGTLAWEGYRYTTQTISELSAVGAPSRPLVVPLFLAHSMLVIAFGLGVWISANGWRRLRIAGGLLMAIGTVDLLAPLFPMHQRGAVISLTDSLHIVLTSVTVFLILLAVGFAATAFGRRFQAYSIGTILALLLFGALTSLDGPRLAANLPTPGMGVLERLDVGAYLIWQVALAAALWRLREAAASDGKTALGPAGLTDRPAA